MRVAVGSDHAGFGLKAVIKDRLAEMGHEVVDVGADSKDSVDYPDFAKVVAEGVLSGRYEMGVLVCGSGLGMSMAANRYPGVRAALCHNLWSARMSRRHNDANVLCLGERITGEGLALDILELFFTTEFEGGRHGRRVSKLDAPSRDTE